MDERLIYLIVLFGYLLGKGVFAAVFNREWSAVKSNKLFVYLMTNGVTLVLIFGIYLEFGSVPDSHSLQSNPLTAASFLITAVLYVLTLIGLLTSFFFWPFAKEQRIVFKTLVLVVSVIFAVEIISYLTSAKSSLPGFLT